VQACRPAGLHRELNRDDNDSDHDHGSFAAAAGPGAVEQRRAGGVRCCRRRIVSERVSRKLVGIADRLFLSMESL
jgi:hypothetical protein